MFCTRKPIFGIQATPVMELRHHALWLRPKRSSLGSKDFVITGQIPGLRESSNTTLNTTCTSSIVSSRSMVAALVKFENLYWQTNTSRFNNTGYLITDFVHDVCWLVHKHKDALRWILYGYWSENVCAVKGIDVYPQIENTDFNDKARKALDEARLEFHSDQGATDLIALLSINKAKEGGESKWVSAVAIHNELLRRGREVALPCLALPCLALPCLALPCLALPCLALPCLALPCLALPCLALPCLALPCLALPCLALPCLALPFLALPCLASNWILSLLKLCMGLKPIFGCILLGSDLLVFLARDRPLAQRVFQNCVWRFKFWGSPWGCPIKAYFLSRLKLLQITSNQQLIRWLTCLILPIAVASAPVFWRPLNMKCSH